MNTILTKHAGRQAISQCPVDSPIVNEPTPRQGEIAAEINILYSVVEELEKVITQLEEKLGPITYVVPACDEKPQEPPPNRTKCGQAIRELRTRVANVVVRLRLQIEGTEL